MSRTGLACAAHERAVGEVDAAIAASNAAAASLAGLALVIREFGGWKGRARVGGGRGDLRRALYFPALSAARFNPSLKPVRDRLRVRGKPARVAIVALMRKLIVLANVLLRDDRITETLPVREKKQQIGPR